LPFTNSFFATRFSRAPYQLLVDLEAHVGAHERAQGAGPALLFVYQTHGEEALAVYFITPLKAVLRARNDAKPAGFTSLSIDLYLDHRGRISTGAIPAIRVHH